MIHALSRLSCHREETLDWSGFAAAQIRSLERTADGKTRVDRALTDGGFFECLKTNVTQRGYQRARITRATPQLRRERRIAAPEKPIRVQVRRSVDEAARGSGQASGEGELARESVRPISRN